MMIFFTRAGHHPTSGHVRVLPCSGHRDRADLRGGRGRITTTVLSLTSSSGREICRCEYFYTRTHTLTITHTSRLIPCRVGRDNRAP